MVCIGRKFRYFYSFLLYSQKNVKTNNQNQIYEKQYVVDELTDEEYKNIYLKAVEISSVNKAENTTKPESEIRTPKKWWEFWK
ncbi:hypothetical protein [Chryseobacterium sp. VD8]|uniref:hypothetical protein n=1 Tax=unclassified Chryseobacterium TaxID=2593645 RepID=UPI003015EDC5